ncbi:MAG: hypothetical protein GY803_03290 [Chloroflexi bacterium]|nr:hypothetical protein [Chloroflexota bacterium]
MGAATASLSSALLAAQRRLLDIREERQAKCKQPVAFGDHGRSPTPVIHNQLSAISLPAHLGWGSPAVTAVLRKSETASGQVGKSANLQISEPANLQTCKPAATKDRRLQTCKLHPDVALGMLREELAAAGRIWLLLRHINKEGSGWVSLEEAREKLTRKESGLRVCGWRQLRNLLNQGKGIFWERRDGRIWLRSIAKTAAALGVWKLTSQPVAIPVAALLGGMGEARAHLYASFHSGRARNDKKASPIARDTIAEISRVNERTQRLYEKRAKVRKKYNFAVGPQINELKEEEVAWRQGQAAFRLLDRDGKHGRKGAAYLAWQLPNQYAGPHAKLPRGRQKRINRELADLFMKGMTGNGRNPVDDDWRPKRYFENGRLAAKAYQRANDPIYWQNPQFCNKRQLWHVLRD